MNDQNTLQQIIEGLLLASGKAMSLEQIGAVFNEEERPDNAALKEALEDIATACEGRGFELKKVSSGYRFQVRQEVSEWVSRLWEEKPQRYSRALMETLAIIAYRQPLTRGDIEKIRGVAVNTQIVRTLQDREWIRVVGHRDVPGRPAMYATTRQFLDYFNLENLDQLPALAEIRDLDEVKKEMNQELTLEQDNPGSRVLELPQTEGEDEEYTVLDEAGEAMVAWATQPLSSILGEDRQQEEDTVENELDLSLPGEGEEKPADSDHPVDADTTDSGEATTPSGDETQRRDH